jgi:hypothetical protein
MKQQEMVPEDRRFLPLISYTKQLLTRSNLKSCEDRCFGFDNHIAVQYADLISSTIMMKTLYKLCHYKLITVTV